MRKADVKLGEKYIAKVSGKRVLVRIDAESHFGGWTATNTGTNRQIRIRTAGRLTPISQPKAREEHNASQ